MDLAVLGTYVLAMALSLGSSLLALLVVLMPLMLYHYGLLRAMYVAWLCSGLSTVVMMLLAGGLMAAAFFSGQLAATFRDMTVNPSNYSLDII